MKSTYKRDQNRIYRARQRIMKQCFYMHSGSLKLEVYPVDIHDFHNFFAYVNKLDKIENPYVECITLI